MMVLVVALSACEATPPPPAAQTETARAAARDACISRELNMRADESVVALEEFETEALSAIGPAQAALEFARALQQHAMLRHAATAHADSALNHARTPADSTRYMQAAESFLPRSPDPGTLEHNVVAAWLRDYATIRADEDHRCNWDF
jgi:hypothetical protein